MLWGVKRVLLPVVDGSVSDDLSGLGLLFPNLLV
jgi:hypothetical protein